VNPLVAQKNNYSYVSDRHKNDGSSIFEDASEKSVETELYSSHGSRPFHIVSLSLVVVEKSNGYGSNTNLKGKSGSHELRD
jgi:hypothetical protein